MRHIRILPPLFTFALLAGLGWSAPALASDCPELSGGTCRHHGACDAADPRKHCRDTLRRDGYHCVCRRGADDRGPGHQRLQRDLNEDQQEYESEGYEGEEYEDEGYEGEPEENPE
ncbi:MAG: hypothetical protein ACT4OG_09955 [Alphaproteobacteria bacterium]